MRKYFFSALLCILLTSCTSFLDVNGKLIPADQEPVEISFSTWEDAILLEAEINGQKGVFLFDNGFTYSAVSPDFAQRANIEFDTAISTTDMHNQRRELPLTVVDRLTIKDQAFVNTKFYLLDTRIFSPCTHLDGIIGASIVNLVNWEIDYSTRTINLSSTPFDQDGHKLDVAFSSNNSTFASIGVNNLSVRTKIDFGKISDELTLSLEHTSEYFSGFEAIENTGIKSISAHGLGSPMVFYELADRMPIDVDGQVLPVEPNTSLVENLKYGGYLGAGYFRNYEKVIINSTRKEYILRDLEDNDSPSFRQSKSYGITLYEVDGTWQVVQLESSDPMFDDITVSDEVSLLDDEPISRFNDICEYKDYLKAKREREEALKITLADGSEYELRLSEPETSILE